MDKSQNFVGSSLSMLESHAVRKAAREAGFDILSDQVGAVYGESSHSPERCVLWSAFNGGFIVGLCMGDVVCALEVDLGCAIPAGSMPPTKMHIAGAFMATDLPALEALLKRAWVLARTLPNALVRRFEQAVVAISATEREATVRQRVGQNLFREGLMALWGGRCAITGLDVPELLRASHAKPWVACNDAERLDVYNGLLLAAHWDAAFDVGLVTIAGSGAVIASPKLSSEGRIALGCSEALVIRLQAQHQPYLQWHRDTIFKN